MAVGVQGSPGSPKQTYVVPCHMGSDPTSSRQNGRGSGPSPDTDSPKCCKPLHFNGLMSYNYNHNPKIQTALKRHIKVMPSCGGHNRKLYVQYPVPQLLALIAKAILHFKPFAALPNFEQAFITPACSHNSRGPLSSKLLFWQRPQQHLLKPKP